MAGTAAGLAIAVFLACAVEAVEALTIVLAVGLERGWAGSLRGVTAALATLTVLVAALGPAVTAIPIALRRVLVGGLLLIFGLQWLRKAILRAAGIKALHDETATFATETQRARTAQVAGTDHYAFAVAYKAVLLEGLEVVFIVLTFGANQGHVLLAAAAAAVAVLVVGGAGYAARAPLARVPENAMKFAVGVMLCAFGTFWATDGVGGRWPGGDGALLVLIPVYAIASLTLAAMLRVRTTVAPV